jgi:2-methylcitrate dehydratase PrpD
MAEKIIDNLSAYMLSARAAELPVNVVQKAKNHILDTLAAIVSGSQLKPGRLGLEFVRSQTGKPECLVLASNVLTTAPLAAFANGMSAHADETDDTISSLHPGCAIVPAALALAELQNRSGLDFLKAVVLGYDIGYRFHESFKRRSTSFGATFGAAAAAGCLARLDAKQLCYLISYAGQQASGSRAWVGDDEHVEKAFDYGGMPAQNGIMAALLVQMGFTGNRDILEGDTNILETFVPCDPSELLSELGQRYAITRCLIKKYSTGSPMMEAIDALVQIVQENKIHARDVAALVARLPRRGAELVNNRRMPDVNIQYILSAILMDGGLTFAAAHDHERMQDKQLLDVKERVQLVADDEFERAGTRYQAIVEVTMRDGRTFRQHRKNCFGRPDNPMPPEEVEKKAVWLMEPVLGEQRTGKVLASVRNIESVATIRDLTGLLMPDKDLPGRD